MEWSDLQIFLFIAREGTLSAAARKLGQSQPTMGRRLKSLEDKVGQRLFQRTAAGFVMTDEGATMLGFAERMEAQVFGLQRQLDGHDQQLEGMVRISASDWYGSLILTPVIAEFATLHPQVVIELITSARHYSLSRREADLIFKTRPFEEIEAVSRKLMHMPYGAYIKSGLPHPIAWDGLGTALITMDTFFEEMPDAIWLRRILPRAHIISRSNDRDVQANLCALGVGVAVLPRPLAESLNGIEEVDLGELPPGRDTWVGYHRDLRQLARLRALLNLMIERLAA